MGSVPLSQVAGEPSTSSEEVLLGSPSPGWQPHQGGYPVSSMEPEAARMVRCGFASADLNGVTAVVPTG